MSDQSLCGALGSVVRAVPGDRRPGEIRVVSSGEPVMLLAYCAEELPVGTRVSVVHSRGSRQVDVERWPRTRR